MGILSTVQHQAWWPEVFSLGSVSLSYVLFHGIYLPRKLSKYLSERRAWLIFLALPTELFFSWAYLLSLHDPRRREIEMGTEARVKDTADGSCTFALPAVPFLSSCGPHVVSLCHSALSLLVPTHRDPYPLPALGPHPDVEDCEHLHPFHSFRPVTLCVPCWVLAHCGHLASSCWCVVSSYSPALSAQHAAPNSTR